MKKKMRDKLIMLLMALSFILPIVPSISANAITQNETTIIYTGSQIAESLPNLGWYPYNGGYAWNKYGKNKNIAGILGKIYILNGIGDNDAILILEGHSSSFKSEMINTLKLFVPNQYNYLYDYIKKSNITNGTTLNIDGRKITLIVDKSGVATIYFGGIDKTKVLSIDNISTSVNKGKNYKLPKTVTAKMADGSKKQLPIIWNIPAVNTSKLGNFTFYGIVSGYSNKVKLTLKI